MNGEIDSDALRARVAELEIQLRLAKELLQQKGNASGDKSLSNGLSDTTTEVHQTSCGLEPILKPEIHNLLILSDSALPLGSFAYSNGLESFLAHHKPLPPNTTPLLLLHRFLRLSISYVAFANIPYVLAAFREPESLANLDNDLDASTPCRVAQAASIAQGRALLSVWEKSLVWTARAQFPENARIARVISAFNVELKQSTLSTSVTGINGHLAPLWGVVSLALSQSLGEMAYLFLFNHAKAILSAAVRANVLGPYMAQSVLAGQDLQQMLGMSLERVWNLTPEDAGQIVPSMDLWVGRHEMLYSKIFNS